MQICVKLKVGNKKRSYNLTSCMFSEPIVSGLRYLWRRVFVRIDLHAESLDRSNTRKRQQIDSTVLYYRFVV
jgi:hypothetical protein